MLFLDGGRVGTLYSALRIQETRPSKLRHSVYIGANGPRVTSSQLHARFRYLESMNYSRECIVLHIVC